MVAPDGMAVWPGGHDGHVQHMSEPLLRQSFAAVLEVVHVVMHAVAH